MSFLKDIKPATKMTIVICITLIVITLIAAAATTGSFDIFLDGLFSLAEAKK